jgi:eukaryotic-like serine/threonine-protein kinase
VTPERWQRIRPILESALELPPAERPAFLEQACGDADLRAEIESLLESNDAAQPGALRTGGVSDSILSRPVFRLPAGTRIGAYEVVEEIAVGGMGAVYRVIRADGQYEQDAALKIMRAELGGDVAIARFRNERQILARLDHPNIARILDGGVTAEGIPYLVMEFIAGKPITGYCDEHRHTVDQRIRLILQVCAAIHYAHQNLVVHRDIKPSNILVAESGAPKLLDFGIAKVLDDTTPPDHGSQTIVGGNWLTPDYASPEQLLGEPVTTVTDVYLLGLLLYELLSGRRAVQIRSRAPAAITQSLEREPRRPSEAIDGEDAEAIAASRGTSIDKLRRRLAGDLDNIILKALRKIPGERYSSVQELVEDLQRHRDGRPVAARGQSLSYRVGKFASRHRSGLAAAVLLFVTLLGGIVATSHKARQEQLQRARAERHFASVRTLADTFIFKVHDSLALLPGAAPARGILIDTGLEYLNALSLEAGDDAALKLDLAMAFERLADIQGQPNTSQRGHERSALESYRKSSAMLDEILASDPKNDQALRTLGNSLMQQSRLVSLLDGPAAALPLSARSIRVYEDLFRDSADDKYKLSIAITTVTHAMNLLHANDREAALDLVERAIHMSERLVADYPQSIGAKRRLGWVYMDSALVVSGIEYNADDIARALTLHRKSLALNELVAASSQGNDANDLHMLANSHQNIGNMLALQGNFAAAAISGKTSLELLDKLQARQQSPQLEVDIASGSAAYARWLVELGKANEAMEMATGALAVLERATARSETARTQIMTAAALEAIGAAHQRKARSEKGARQRREWEQARAAFQRAVATFEKAGRNRRLPVDESSVVERARAGVVTSVAALESSAL